MKKSKKKGYIPKSNPKQSNTVKLEGESLKLFSYLKWLIKNNPDPEFKFKANVPRLIEILSMERYKDSKEALVVKEMLSTLSNHNRSHVITSINKSLKELLTSTSN